MDRPTARRHMAAAAVVGLALRLAFGLLYWVDKPLTHDEREYLALASGLADGRGFKYHDPPAGTTAQFGRAPGYPAFLAAIGAGREAAALSASPARVKIAQAILGAATIVLIAIAAARAAGPPAGAVAAWLAAIYPPLVWIPAYVFSESLYAVLALAAALALQTAVAAAPTASGRRAPAARALAAGLLSGAAILVRPAMLFWVPLAVIWLVWRRASNYPLALVFVCGAAMLVAPWTIRNVREYGQFVLVASEGGVTFWTGNHPLARGEGDLAANPDLKVAELEFRRAHAGLSSEQLERVYYRDALGHIAADPVWWAGLLARKAFYTVVPAGPSYALHSFRYRAASVISYGLLLPFAIAGMVALARSPRRPAALLSLAAAHGLVCVMFFPQERFRIPVIDPVLIVCAAALAGRRAALATTAREAGRPE